MYRVELICDNGEASFAEAHCVVGILQGDQVEMDRQRGRADGRGDGQLLHIGLHLFDHPIGLFNPPFIIEQPFFLIKK